MSAVVPQISIMKQGSAASGHSGPHGASMLSSNSLSSRNLLANQKSVERVGMAGAMPQSIANLHNQNIGKADGSNAKSQSQAYSSRGQSNSKSNAETGIQRVPSNLGKAGNSGNRSPFGKRDNMIKLGHPSLPSDSSGKNLDVTPTNDTRSQHRLANQSSKMYPLRESDESIRSHNQKSNPSSRTQRLVQKSVESRDGRKNLEAASSREILLWSQA